MPFRTFGLDANILKAVQEAGYTEPTPIQSAAIPQILAGHDLIGIAQTGTGKTAAFVLPILAKLAPMSREGGQHSIRALIVAPTRELVAQIEENVRGYGNHLCLSAATIYGGVGERALTTSKAPPGRAESRPTGVCKERSAGRNSSAGGALRSGGN